MRSRMSIDGKSKARFVCSSELKPSSIVQTIPISPSAVGCVPKIYNLAMPLWKQERLCGWCGKIVKPRMWQEARRRFCDKSCSANWRMRQPVILSKVHNPQVAAKRGKKKSAWYRSGSPKALKELERIRNLNPMSDPNVRQEVCRILKAVKHKPSVRGGNGHGATLPQRIMHKILGSKWNMEYPLSLGKRIPGYPTHYKLDLANPEKKIAIEVDGFSHRSRKKIDQKKDAKLASFGWKVLRFWNRDILTWNDTGMPRDTYISMTLAQHGILLFR